jgi:glycine/D-amino acid oxidase-like deaminating enzyme
MGPSGLGLERYSLEFYRELATSGHEIGYRSNGNLVLSLVAGSWSGRPSQVLSDRDASPGTRSLTPMEVAELTGVVDPGAVYGGVLMPSGIQLDAGPAVQAVAGLVAEMGGSILTGVTVEGFDVLGGGVRKVKTSSGDLEAAGVVLAAGGWTNQLLRHLDCWLPLLPVVATRLVTEDLGVPGTMPTIQCPDARLWIREANGGFTWGTLAGYEPLYRFEQDNGALAPGRPRSDRLFEAARDTQARVAEVFPCLAGAEITSWLQGLAVFTPDRNLVIGKVPGLENAVVLAGDNEAGVSHGPAMGKAGAELIEGVAPFVDVTACRADRFDLAAFPDEPAIEAHLIAVGAAAFASHKLG